MTSLACDAVLFDMDGTLVDSTESITVAWSTFGSRHRIDAATLAATVHGRAGRDIVTALLGEDADVEAELAAVREVELDTLHLVREIAGAEQLLRRLPADRWAVVTSAPRDLFSARMRAAGLPLPDVAVCAGETEHGKPDPAPFRRGAELLGVAPGSCVVFEDSPAGLAAGARAGAGLVSIGPAPLPDHRVDGHVADLTRVSVTRQGGTLQLNLR